MQFFDPNNPNEKKKMIAAGVLALVAIAILGYVFFGGGSSTPATNVAVAKPSPSTRVGVRPSPEPTVEESFFQPISYNVNPPAYSEADRNIFAFYIPPTPTPKVVVFQTPTPTPTPPLTASSLTPSSVYARTADFSLQLTGDKFTSAVKIILDGRELPTRFVSSQQLFATVPATLITNPGVRQVMARSGDGALYSNTLSLNITPPPVPNFSYVGIIGKPRFNDTAVLQDKTSKDFIRVQRGDPVGGRYRVVSISEREVKLIDTTLKIPHTLTFTADQANSPLRPPVRSGDDDPM